jgi:L-lactate dehydrogenase complex protein LldE
MKVGLFVTCLVDLVRPNIGFAALKLLEDAGCEVVVPESQTCCGQPGYNSGARELSKTLARKVLSEFSHCDYVVAPSGSCSGQIKVHAVEDLFNGEPEEAEFRALASRWYELSDFLINVLKVKSLPGMPGDFAGTVTYHDSCSGLRAQIKQPRARCSQAGCTLSEMQDAEKCWDSAAHSQSLGDILARGGKQMRRVGVAGADALVGGDLGCLLNIEGRLRRNGDMKTKVFHFAEVAAGMTRAKD